MVIEEFSVSVQYQVRVPCRVLYLLLIQKKIWLHTRVTEGHPACLLPSLPPKTEPAAANTFAKEVQTRKECIEHAYKSYRIIAENGEEEATTETK